MPWYEYSLTATGLEPVASVRLLYGARLVHVNALVDSGADISLFDIRLADLLGLDRNNARQHEVFGATGDPILVYEWSRGLLELRFEEQRIPYEGAFTEFTNPDSLNILGRQDFFGRYIIQFWDTRRLMNIDLSPDFARRPSGQRVLREDEAEHSFE